MNNKFTYKSEYGVYDNCYLMGGYYCNGNLGLEIWNDEIGPITKVTTNPGVKISDDYIVVKNYSENEGIEEFLVENNIVVPEPIRYILTGFVEVPVYRLSDDIKDIIVGL